MNSRLIKRHFGLLISIALLSSFISAQETLNDGLVGLWTFEDPHVLERDESGYKQDAVNNSVEVTTGIVGDHAARFNGATSNITIYNTVKWDPELNSTVPANYPAMSVSAWFRTKQKAEAYTSIIRHQKHFIPFQLTPNGTARVVTFHPDPNDNLEYDWDGEYNDSTWHHIVVSFLYLSETTGGVTEAWIDTVRIKQMSGMPLYLVPDSTNNYPWMFGMTESGNEAYNGELDQVRLYNRLLKYDEIRKLYHEPTNPIELPTSIDNSMVELPTKLNLGQNYPNPFNPTTTISYDLPGKAQVILGIYDMLGKQVKTLVNQPQDAGNKIAMWDGTDEFGRQVSAGVYLYQIQAGEFSQTRKMLLLK